MIFNFVRKADTFIQHFSFCISHSLPQTAVAAMQSRSYNKIGCICRPPRASIMAWGIFVKSATMLVGLFKGSS